MRLRILSAAVFLCGSSLAAQEQTIKRSALPPAVERTVVAQSKGATIRGFSKEVDRGQTSYEVALSVNGLSKDISMDSSGSVIEIEEQVTLESLPPAVLTGISAQAGTALVSRVERLTKHGRVVAYEAHLTIDGKRTEIQVGPGGEKLDHEE